ncbi:uncharacterized protein IWZ02DRAFT_436453 [Phyllosticta citriasiana]|uniref:uncharacterized protein n=1 Tax=Phyllosticta citriasiana TaxID=595635 RepID=UPI0030FD4EE1
MPNSANITFPKDVSTPEGTRQFIKILSTLEFNNMALQLQERKELVSELANEDPEAWRDSDDSSEAQVLGNFLSMQTSLRNSVTRKFEHLDAIWSRALWNSTSLENGTAVEDSRTLETRATYVAMIKPVAADEEFDVDEENAQDNSNDSDHSEVQPNEPAEGSGDSEPTHNDDESSSDSSQGKQRGQKRRKNAQLQDDARSAKTSKLRRGLRPTPSRADDEDYVAGIQATSQSAAEQNPGVPTRLQCGALQFGLEELHGSPGSRHSQASKP